jgi:hypothetical protein
VPQSLIDEMESVGMPIYTGNRPPTLSIGGKTYKATPFVLGGTNITGDYAIDIVLRLYC